MLTWHGDERLAEAEHEMSQRVLRGAVYFTAQHQQRLGVSVFAEGETIIRSKPGEYPRKERGIGQANILHWPTTPEEVKANGMKAKVGARMVELVAGLPHLVFLERFKERLGFKKTAAELKDVIRALIEG